MSAAPPGPPAGSPPGAGRAGAFALGVLLGLPTSAIFWFVVAALTSVSGPLPYFFSKWAIAGFGAGLSVVIVIAARRARPGLLQGLIVGVGVGILLQSLCWGLVSSDPAAAPRAWSSRGIGTREGLLTTGWAASRG